MYKKVINLVKYYYLRIYYFTVVGYFMITQAEVKVHGEKTF